MKTANEIRNLYLVKANTGLDLNSLKERASLQIEGAAKVGMTQTTLTFNRSKYKEEDVTDLQQFLLQRGFVIMKGQTSGFLGNNLLVDPKVTLTVMW